MGRDTCRSCRVARHFCLSVALESIRIPVDINDADARGLPAIPELQLKLRRLTFWRARRRFRHELDELARPYKLAADGPALLDEHGFIRLRAVLSKDLVRHYQPEITQKVIELNTMHLPLEERDTYSRAFLQVENLWRSSTGARELVLARHLAQIAAELLGVDGVRLYADQALYKEPGGGVTPWHADQYYWPLNSDRTITAWIPLQDTPAELGALEFADGSHRFSHGRDLPIGDESERERVASRPELAGLSYR